MRKTSQASTSSMGAEAGTPVELGERVGARPPGSVPAAIRRTTMGDFIRLEIDTDPRVATIRLDRPKVNALNDQVLVEIEETCAALEVDNDIRSVVVWGGPKAFGGGVDIDQFPDYGPAEAEALSHRLNRALLRIERLPQITIAAINGYALGGGLELAMATDFRMAATGALLGQPEILLGIIPGGGGTQRLTRLIGVSRAKELIYSGDRITAERALEIGLVSSVHEPDVLYDAALEAARYYAAGAASLRMAKKAILDGLHLSLEEAVAMEARQFGASFGTDDVQIGLASFAEHGPGKAEFTGQ